MLTGITSAATGLKFTTFTRCETLTKMVPVYAVSGNHDHRTAWPEIAGVLEKPVWKCWKTGMYCCKNGRTLVLAGVGDPIPAMMICRLHCRRQRTGLSFCWPIHLPGFSRCIKALWNFACLLLGRPCCKSGIDIMRTYPRRPGKTALSGRSHNGFR